MWTKINKPSANSYTKVGKPTNGFMVPRGTATGLLCSPTYATVHTVGKMWTNLSKPSSNSWTKINKPV